MDVVSQTGEFNHPADVPPRNLFLVTLPGMFTLLETKLTFAPNADFQQAGLLVYGNDTTYLKFDRLYASNAPLTTGNQVVEYVGSPALDNFRAWYRATETTLILRLVREGSSVIAQFSTDEADSFTAVDTLPDIAALENARAGIFTINGARGAEEIKAAFDYFKVEW